MKKRTIDTQGKTKKLITQVEELHNVGWKFRLGFDQSVSTGVLNLHGYVNFNTFEEGNEDIHQLEALLEGFESILERRGYLVASKSAPKKNGNSKKEE